MLIRHKNEQICCKHCNRIWICRQYTCSKRILMFRNLFRKWRIHRGASHHICHGSSAKLQSGRKHVLSGFILTLQCLWSIKYGAENYHLRDKWTLPYTWIAQAKKQNTKLNHFFHIDYFINDTKYLCQISLDKNFVKIVNFYEKLLQSILYVTWTYKFVYQVLHPIFSINHFSL